MKFFKFNRAGSAVLTSKPTTDIKLKALCRSELSEAVAHLSGYTKKDVDKILDSYLTAITSSIKEGRAVAIPGFGKFKPRKPRSGRYHNPVSGKTMPAPKKRSMSFQPSTVMKKKLNDGGAGK